jgi:hypothetical protein
MKKIGFLVMALVLALGGLGIGYAHWSDTVIITQTVKTGEVSCGVFAVANEWPEAEGKDVCKVTVTNEGYRFEKNIVTVPGDALFDPGIHKHYAKATIAIENYYPSLNIEEDFVISNAGTIPVKLEVDLQVTDPDGVYKHLDLYLWVVHWVHTLPDGTVIHERVCSGSGKADLELPKIEACLESFQLHPCETLIIYMDKHLQQEAPQGKSASMTMTVDCMQWNLYGVD